MVNPFLVKRRNISNINNRNIYINIVNINKYDNPNLFNNINNKNDKYSNIYHTPKKTISLLKKFNNKK